MATVSLPTVTICSDFEDQENKVCHELMGLDAMIFVFEC